MRALDPWRRELRALIPRGFLKRDQGAGLFVSDYPRHGNADAISAALAAAGYTVERDGALARIDAEADKYWDLLSALPPGKGEPTDETLFPYDLGRRIQRLGGDFSADHRSLARSALKKADAGDLPGLYRLLSPAVAEAQRRGSAVPGALGKLIFQCLELKVKS